MDPKLLTLYRLKLDPFSPDVPTETLYRSPKIENSAPRLRHEYGLHLLAERLARLADLSVGVVHHPQSNFPDFYHELGDCFGCRL